MNDFDFDPTAADLAEVEADLMLEDVSEDTNSDDEWSFDDDYSAHDDRWDGDGVPSWSAWA